MKKHHALDAVLAASWAITPEYLQIITDIACREHEFSGNLEALEARLGRPLGNTAVTTVRDGIAVIPISGPLFKRASFFQAVSGATDYTTLATDLTAALDDPNVRAVMLMIDSPGGEVSGTTDLASMIKAAGKPVWAHIGGTGASAAYWLASAADKIVASDTSIVGSIGVQVGYTARDPRPGERSVRFVSSQSPMKNADPETDAGAQQVQQMVDDLGSVFVATVADNRKVSTATVLEKFGQGGVMVASKALDAGMLDGIATFESAFAALKKEISSMDYSAITAAALAENRPDIVAALRAEGVATVTVPDVAAACAEAVVAERARITAIEGLLIPGAESIIAACKADGSTADAAAVKVIQHMRAGQAGKGAAALANIQKAETDMTPPNADASDDKPTDEQQAIANMEALRAAGVIR